MPDRQLNDTEVMQGLSFLCQIAIYDVLNANYFIFLLAVLEPVG